MQKELNLSELFPSVSKEAWKEKAISDLKGADFDRKLVWNTYDGFQVQPFYTKDDLPGGITYGVSQGRQRSWINYAQMDVKDEKETNEQAKYFLQFDASGLLFKVDQGVDFGKLLSGIDLNTINISFKSDRPSKGLIEDYFTYCENEGFSMDSLNGFYEADVLESWITGGNEPEFDTLAAICQLTEKAKGFRGLSIQSHAFLNAGGNTTQEVGFLFSKLVEYVTKISEFDISVDKILANTHLHTAIGGDYFFELAKLRAVRLLIPEIYQCFGVNQPDPKILASSSLWSKSLFDPHVNMLRNTTEAMAAVLGGCDALLIQPHDSSYEDPTHFSHRIALNISNLLREESYFDKVHDASSGSYYIENLTANIAEKSLELFKETESKGGFIAAFKSGSIEAAIQSVKDKKEKDLATRKQVIVGTNKYPNLSEKAVHNKEIPGKGTGLSPQRASSSFDTLRLTTLKHFEMTGFIPKVYLACFGNHAMRKARATFSSEFFGTAGFQIMGEFAFNTASEAAAGAAASEADIVVMCASDQDYETDAIGFTRAFKDLTPDKLLILAGYPSEMVDTLKEAGVNGFIHLKTNAIETLSEIQQQLFATTK